MEIGNLNKALADGVEVGAHVNGHFCDDNRPGGNDWDTADWNNELRQFFDLVKNVDVNNGITDRLNLPASKIKGARTPCLTGHKESLYPALEAHGMTFDSFDRMPAPDPAMLAALQSHTSNFGGCPYVAHCDGKITY